MKYELVARTRLANFLRMIPYKTAVDEKYEMAPIIQHNTWLAIPLYSGRATSK